MSDFFKKLGWIIVDISLFLIIFGFLAFGITSLLAIIPAVASIGDDESFQNPILLIITFFPLLISAAIAGYIVHYFVFKRDLALFGLQKQGMVKDYCTGFLFGGLLILAGFFILRLLGYLDILNYNFAYGTIVLFLVFFIVQSLFEEIAFRSYLMPVIESRFGLWPALLISSILFALIHLDNNNIAVLGIINIFLAGMLLGLLFIKYKNVWAAAGLHCSWNYVQSTILGFEVSGESVFNMIETQENGPDLITGGAFGFEGSLISVLFLLGMILYYVQKNSYVMSRLDGMPQIEENIT